MAPSPEFPAVSPASSAPAPAGADLGPCTARCCSDSPPTIAIIDESSTDELSVREVELESWPPDVMGHDAVYQTDCPSLSSGSVVHDTRRCLDSGRSFGRHVRSLRRARGMTQEVLAERCGLSADTIRRLEHGSFSPSLDTLRKLCAGLDLMLSTLFESYELGARNEARELIDLLSSRGSRELVLATRVLRALFDELDGITAEMTAGED